MKNYDILKTRMEEIFKMLNVKYQLLAFDDEDLNYEIQIETVGNLKPLNSINCVLFLSENDMSINLIIGNIYKLDYGKIDLFTLYKTVNHLNNIIKNGSFFIDEDIKQIFFKSSLNCGNNFSELNVGLIKYLILSSIKALENLLIVLRDIENEKK